MSKEEKLLNEIRARGADIRVDGESLVLKPAAVVSDLLPKIREHKHAILQHLSGSAQHQETDEESDLVDFLADVRGHGTESRLLPSVRQYLRRTLPAKMVNEIECAFAGAQGGQAN